MVFWKFVSTVWLPAKEEKEEQGGYGLQNSVYNLRTGLSNFKDNKTISDGGITVDFSIIKVHIPLIIE